MARCRFEGIGNAAVPDAILDKPGPLDDHEWAFMRRQTMIGERIIRRQRLRPRPAATGGNSACSRDGSEAHAVQRADVSTRPELVGDVLVVMRRLANHPRGRLRARGRRLCRLVDGGVVVESGTPAEVLVRPRHERTRAFLSKVL
jgi:hypothetical protein